MRIVLDLQGAQTASSIRGLGRYSLSLARAIAQNPRGHEIIIALNGHFEKTIEPIRGLFSGILPQKNIQVWTPPVYPASSDNSLLQQKISAHIYEAFLANLAPDLIHFLSFFEGYGNPATTSIDQFISVCPIVVSLHDLIPLIYTQDYLEPNTHYKEFYLRKIEQFKQATAWFAVSNSAAHEGESLLKLDKEKIVNTYEGCDSIFKKITIPHVEETILRKKFHLAQAFIMCAGATDVRKNHLSLIKAYAKLPALLRKQHQLAIVGDLPEHDKTTFLKLAKTCGLKEHECVITGKVTDLEMAKLYNLCHLFVFPSWHEGFGLPVLEAMSCGAAVIGSNTSSIPELINDADALFNPFDELAITNKMEEVLTNESFRLSLIENGLTQAQLFSWDKSAQCAVTEYEKIHAMMLEKKQPLNVGSKSRPRLAFVSPLPPEKTGIADYSTSLLSVLACYYDIHVIVEQKKVDSAIKAKFPVHDAAWFMKHSKEFDRIVYQFGNSPFHQYMLFLLKKAPGIVVLHDFFLSELFAWDTAKDESAWLQTLYQAHGYLALNCHLAQKNIKKKYPLNLSVLQQAQGIIVHSEHARQLANQWFPKNKTAHWAVIPHFAAPQSAPVNRIQSRAFLGLEMNELVICSFGFIAPTKLHQQIIEAWSHSTLARNKTCKLIFVGENHGGNYGSNLLQMIKQSPNAENILITGWVDKAIFEHYLAAADIGIQLRTDSRGETSGATLYCMSYGIPTIINKHGSMGEFPDDAFWALPDEFTKEQLVEALERLHDDLDLRISLGKNARNISETQYALNLCAKQYETAIEGFYKKSKANTPQLIQSLVHIEPGNFFMDPQEELAVVRSIAQNSSLPVASKLLFLDISGTVGTQLKTGIERVSLALTRTLILSPHSGYRVEPVYLSNQNGQWHYRYARQYTATLLGLPAHTFVDDIVDFNKDDILLGLDLDRDKVIQASQQGLYRQLRNWGLSVYFIIHDLLPILLEQHFPPNTYETHFLWLKAVAQLDGAICISKTVMSEMQQWLEVNQPERYLAFKLAYSYSGANFANPLATLSIPNGQSSIVDTVNSQPAFLMVGTVEPRKGHLQVIEAFSLLWQQGYEVNLIIIGAEGWLDLPDNQRRTIPHIVHVLNTHPENGRRLFWFKSVSDEALQEMYQHASCYIAASEGEGFGLPLMEAASYHLPILARAIAVFKEILGDNATYFETRDSQKLAKVIINWLDEFDKGSCPTPQLLKSLTWEESAKNLLEILGGDQWPIRWMPRPITKVHDVQEETVS
ncbi:MULTISPECIES: glycosyltransferase [Legionella]|uniref:glycosyltransferase n=1 Tax=Legionella TaxID=445 RepID=UPI000964B6E4|nr:MULTISPECIES: glycosyltransferase [Legionella]MBN9227092.1 glycosyltransferase [Legionella steelei]OJW07343.1 MAG: hypothetical protein BGO44_17125 [Legionella sp. 39-23]